MSVTYYAHTIIGVKIKISDLFYKHKARGCACKEVADKAFCSECGSPMYIEEDVCIDENFEMGSNIIFNSLPLVSRSPDDDHWYIGFKATASEGERGEYFNQIPDHGRVRKIIKEALAPHKLWVESTFGVYTILEENY